jgi:hypothetical protein
MMKRTKINVLSGGVEIWAEEPLVKVEEEGSSFSLPILFINALSVWFILIGTFNTIGYYW